MTCAGFWQYTFHASPSQWAQGQNWCWWCISQDGLEYINAIQCPMYVAFHYVSQTREDRRPTASLVKKNAPLNGRTPVAKEWRFYAAKDLINLQLDFQQGLLTPERFLSSIVILGWLFGIYVLIFWHLYFVFFDIYLEY